jgi:hypothetical protein
VRLDWQNNKREERNGLPNAIFWGGSIYHFIIPCWPKEIQGKMISWQHNNCKNKKNYWKAKNK